MTAILYVLTTGCQWRQLPKDFPSKSVVHDCLVCWDSVGVLARVHDALYAMAPVLAARNATAISELNDRFRSTLSAGRVYVTVGVDTLAADIKAIIRQRVATFDAFAAVGGSACGVRHSQAVCGAGALASCPARSRVTSPRGGSIFQGRKMLAHGLETTRLTT